MATGVRFNLPYPSVLVDGAIAPGALVNFYLTGSSTPAPTYADYALTTANLNPVVADANGQLPAIFLNPSVLYKVVITDSSGANGVTADPVSSGLAAVIAALNLGTAAGYNVGTSGNTLGLLNANLTFSGAITSQGFITLVAGANLTPQATPNANDVGYMGFPQNVLASGSLPYTLLMTDLGKDVIAPVTGTINIPANASLGVALGQWVMVTAAVGATVTLSIGGSDILRWPVGNVTGSRTITGPGFAVIQKKYATEWWVTGAMNVT